MPAAAYRHSAALDDAPRAQLAGGERLAGELCRRGVADVAHEQHVVAAVVRVHDGELKLRASKRRRLSRAVVRRRARARATHRASAVRQRHAAKALLQLRAVHRLKLLKLLRCASKSQRRGVGALCLGAAACSCTSRQSAPYRRLGRASCRAAARGARAARPGSASRRGLSPARCKAFAFCGTARPSSAAGVRQASSASAAMLIQRLRNSKAARLGEYRDRRGVRDDVHRGAAGGALPVRQRRV